MVGLGDGEGLGVGVGTGVAVGLVVGCVVPEAVGLAVGCAEAEAVGTTLGEVLGTFVGVGEGVGAVFKGTLRGGGLLAPLAGTCTSWNNCASNLNWASKAQNLNLIELDAGRFREMEADRAWVCREVVVKLV